MSNFKPLHSINEPLHGSSNNVAYVTLDQPAHMGSLIGAFACRLNILEV